jgi:hypothetical protein
MSQFAFTTRWTSAAPEGERSPPLRRRHRAVERLEQWRRVAVGDREHGDLRDHLDVLQREAFGILGGADARRQRVADVQGVHDAAALDACLGPGRSLGKRLAVEVPVVARVGVDEATDRAVLAGDLWLDAAPGVAVARDDDRALDRDAQPLEPVVVLRDAVVDVDEPSGHVAVDRVGVVRRKLLGLLVGGRVDGDGRLRECGDELRRRDHLDPALLGGGEQHVERLDARVEPPLLELRQDPLRVVLVVRRADVVRARGEPLHVLAHVRGVRNRPELRLPIALDPRRGIGEPGKRRLGRRSGGEDERGCRQQSEKPELSHGTLPAEPRKGVPFHGC